MDARSDCDANAANSAQRLGVQEHPKGAEDMASYWGKHNAILTSCRREEDRNLSRNGDFNNRDVIPTETSLIGLTIMRMISELLTMMDILKVQWVKSNGVAGCEVGGRKKEGRLGFELTKH